MVNNRLISDFRNSSSFYFKDNDVPYGIAHGGNNKSINQLYKSYLYKYYNK